MKGKREAKWHRVEGLFAPHKEDWHAKKEKSDKLLSKEPGDPDNHAFKQKITGARHHWLQKEMADVVAELREEQEAQQQVVEGYSAYETPYDDIESTSSSTDEGAVHLQRGSFFHYQLVDDYRRQEVSLDEESDDSLEGGSGLKTTM